MQDKKYMTKRERVKDLSNKAEGIYYYIGPQHMLFRLSLKMKSKKHLLSNFR